MILILAKCEYPITDSSHDNQIDNSVKVTGYIDPAIEGTNINFSCSTGLILSGPKNSTCYGNGEWKPDPETVECTGKVS